MDIGEALRQFISAHVPKPIGTKWVMQTTPAGREWWVCRRVPPIKKQPLPSPCYGNWIDMAVLIAYQKNHPGETTRVRYMKKRNGKLKARTGGLPTAYMRKTGRMLPYDRVMTLMGFPADWVDGVEVDPLLPTKKVE